jgi:hypothetical protein
VLSLDIDTDTTVSCRELKRLRLLRWRILRNKICAHKTAHTAYKINRVRWIKLQIANNSTSQNHFYNKSYQMRLSHNGYYQTDGFRYHCIVVNSFVAYMNISNTSRCLYFYLLVCMIMCSDIADIYISPIWWEVSPTNKVAIMIYIKGLKIHLSNLL